MYFLLTLLDTLPSLQFSYRNLRSCLGERAVAIDIIEPEGGVFLEVQQPYDGPG
jgi:hypothetical protein